MRHYVFRGERGRERENGALLELEPRWSCLKRKNSRARCRERPTFHNKRASKPTTTFMHQNLKLNTNDYKSLNQRPWMCRLGCSHFKTLEDFCSCTKWWSRPRRPLQKVRPYIIRKAYPRLSLSLSRLGGDTAKARWYLRPLCYSLFPCWTVRVRLWRMRAKIWNTLEMWHDVSHKPIWKMTRFM